MYQGINVGNTVDIIFQGVVKHLHLLPHELEDYEDQVEKVLRRYVKRLQWLLSGDFKFLFIYLISDCRKF